VRKCSKCFLAVESVQQLNASPSASANHIQTNTLTPATKLSCTLSNITAVWRTDVTNITLHSTWQQQRKYVSRRLNIFLAVNVFKIQYVLYIMCIFLVKNAKLVLTYNLTNMQSDNALQLHHKIRNDNKTCLTTVRNNADRASLWNVIMTLVWGRSVLHCWSRQLKYQPTSLTLYSTTDRKQQGCQTASPLWSWHSRASPQASCQSLLNGEKISPVHIVERKTE